MFNRSGDQPSHGAQQSGLARFSCQWVVLESDLSDLGVYVLQIIV
jgi:hypothetical protein